MPTKRYLSLYQATRKLSGSPSLAHTRARARTRTHTKAEERGNPRAASSFGPTQPSIHLSFLLLGCWWLRQHQESGRKIIIGGEGRQRVPTEHKRWQPTTARAAATAACCCCCCCCCRSGGCCCCCCCGCWKEEDFQPVVCIIDVISHRTSRQTDCLADTYLPTFFESTQHCSLRRHADSCYSVYSVYYAYYTYMGLR